MSFPMNPFFCQVFATPRFIGVTPNFLGLWKILKMKTMGKLCFLLPDEYIWSLKKALLMM